MPENYIFFILQCVMLRCSSDKSVGSGGNLTEFAVGVHKVFFFFWEEGERDFISSSWSFDKTLSH